MARRTVGPRRSDSPRTYVRSTRIIGGLSVLLLSGAVVWDIASDEASLEIGKFKPLSDGEIAARAAGYKPYSAQTWRAWQYWANRAGCGHMVGKRPTADAK